LREGVFEDIWIQSAAGDAGGALGAAYAVHHQYFGKERPPAGGRDRMQGAYLGPAFDDLEIRSVAKKFQAPYETYADVEALCRATASQLAQGRAVGWFQGRMEWGPRALGNRSILADPRNRDMKDILNARVKFREAFRPFTPSVLKERASEYFTLDVESPFMLLAPYVKPGKAEVVPAITHVDNTARVQTVERSVNERYYDLIKAFEKLTGIPILLNTSFNVAGEPIVETPEDAVRCFLSTDIDILGIDRFMMTKTKKHSGS